PIESSRGWGPAVRGEPITMNGIHDLGGMHGFGPVDPEPNEPVFHHDWERRAFALNLAAGFLGRWNIDMGRYAREHMPPAEYLATTYYEHWLYGLERLLVEKGLVTGKELEAMRPQGPVAGVKALGVDDVPQRCYSGRFEGRELCGPDAGPRDAIYIDLFEPYLEPAFPEGGHK